MALTFPPQMEHPEIAAVPPENQVPGAVVATAASHVGGGGGTNMVCVPSCKFAIIYVSLGF